MHQVNIENHGYIYILIRTDLTPEQQCVQSCHAAIETARHNIDKYLEHPSVIICSIKNEDKLSSMKEFLQSNNIGFREFREPDIGNQLTAIATEVLYGDQRKHMRKFQLLKFKGVK